MKKKNRVFETKKVELKTEALKLWREGVKVSEIAEILGKSRDTIYRWIKEASDKLGGKTSRKRHLVDESTRNRIIELYILMRAPSMRVLSEALLNYFYIRLSPHQLRRLLKKWSLLEWSPSPAYESIRRQAMDHSDILINSFSKNKSSKNFKNFLDDFRVKEVSDPINLPDFSELESPSSDLY